MANGNNVRDRLGVSATMGVADNPVFTILNEILDNDMELQRHTRPKLNAAAEAAAAAHDATTRNLIEQVLADEDQHLSGLDTEIALYETLGESLYCASRLPAGKASAA
jgi:bacterioferritin